MDVGTLASRRRTSRQHQGALVRMKQMTEKSVEFSSF
jgi:hypothetical protein